MPRHMPKPSTTLKAAVTALERRVFHLETLLAARGIGATTLEQAVMAYFRVYATADAPSVVTYAEREFHLKFKPTSVSAILCKLTRLKILKKERRDTGTFHTYSKR